MGVEIYKLVQRLVKGNGTNIPNEENGFFRYLKTALYRAEKEYYRNNKENHIDIPKETKKRLKIIDDMIILNESNLGRKLTENERRQCIPEKWFSIAEYTELINLKNAGNVEFIPGNASINPYVDFFSEVKTQEIKNALSQLFQNTQDRTRDCYRALFTAYCIDRSIGFEGLTQLLDSKILEAYRKSGKKPKQHEIYLKYHPDVKKESASVRASDMTKDFLNKLRKTLNKIQ
jgi:hypothetical protein